MDRKTEEEHSTGQRLFGLVFPRIQQVTLVRELPQKHPKIHGLRSLHGHCGRVLLEQNVGALLDEAEQGKVVQGRAVCVSSPRLEWFGNNESAMEELRINRQISLNVEY